MTTNIAAEGTAEGTKTPKVGRRMGEEALREKIDNRGQPVTFLAGTLEYVTPEVADEIPELANHVGKQVVQKECEETGDVFYVATSDLHQCFYTEANGVRRKMRAAKAKERREAKKAKAEKDAAELKQLRGADEAEASEAASA